MGRMHTPGLAVFDLVFDFYFLLLFCHGCVSFRTYFYIDSVIE